MKTYHLRISKYLITLLIIFWAASSCYTQADSLRKSLALASTDLDSLNSSSSLVHFYIKKKRNCDSVLYFTNLFFNIPSHKRFEQALRMADARTDCIAFSDDSEALLNLATLIENFDYDEADAARFNYRIWRCKTMAYRVTDSLVLAIDALDKMLHYALELDNDRAVMNANYELMQFYLQYPDGHPIAIKYSQDNYRLAHKAYVKDSLEAGNIYNLFIATINLGSVFREIEQLDSSIIYSKKALNQYAINQGIIPPVLESISKVEYSTALLENGQLDKALQVIEEALPVVEEQASPYDVMQALLSACTIYDSLQLDDKAKKLIPKLIECNELVDDKQQEAYMYEVLVHHSRKKNPEKALLYREHQMKLEDSIRKENNTLNLARVEAQYRFDNDRKQLSYQQSLQEAKINQQRWQIALGGLLTSLVSILAFIMYRNKRQQEKINQQLLEAHKNLEKSNHRLSRFVHSVSHDIMGKLESMLMTTNLMKIDSLPTTEAQHYYENTKSSTNWLRDYCMGLLTWSERDLEVAPSVVAETDTKLIVEDLLKAYQAELEHYNFEVIVGDLPMVQMLAAPVQQVFKNLIDNAIKYTKDQANPKLKISSILEAEDWIFCIKDNGIGIAAAEQQTLFSATNDHKQRHGRGLSYVKDILLEEEEMIWVDDNDWSGTSFYFTLR